MAKNLENRIGCRKAIEQGKIKQCPYHPAERTCLYQGLSVMHYQNGKLKSTYSCNNDYRKK